MSRLVWNPGLTGLERAQRAHKQLIDRAFTLDDPPTGGAFRILLDEIEAAAECNYPNEWWDAAPHAVGMVWLAELALMHAPRSPVAGRCACGNGTFEVMRAVRCTNCGATFDGPDPELRP